MVVLALAVSVLLNRATLGRHLYAIGSNLEAARLSGVNVNGVTLFAYVLSGLLAGLTGCVLMSRLVTAQPSEGLMYELDAIAAAVIGGTSLTGGVGTVSGTVIGAFVIGILRNGLNMHTPTLRVPLEAVWADEVLPVFDAEGAGPEARAYLVELRDRLLNPFLEHRLADIAKDHAQKKLRRLAPVVERAAALQLPVAQTQLRDALAETGGTPCTAS